MYGSLEIMNRTIERAFSHIATRETSYELLESIGIELECDRVSVFEVHEDGYYDNTYEWCAEGILSERDFLQHLPFAGLAEWRKRTLSGEILCLRHLDEIREDYPEIYQLFHSQNVDTMIVSILTFHKKEIGFVILENPPLDIIEEAEEIIPVFRYVLSALIFSEHLIHKLEKVGYSDALTGTGNRLSLQNHLEGIDKTHNVGLVYCDAFDWNIEDDKPEHLEEELMVIHTGAILQAVFDEDMVFRVGAGEFIAICPDVSENEFMHEIRRVKSLFLEQDLLVAVGSVWADHCEGSFDPMVRQAHLLMYDAKRELSREHELRGYARQEGGMRNDQKKANITLYREDEFFENADLWLSQIFDEEILTILIDINYFRLYNDIYGREAGNLFLESIADTVRTQAREHHGIAGYLGGDNFIMMIPVVGLDNDGLNELLSDQLVELHYSDGFAPAIGAYLSSNRQDAAIALYDRALFALSEIRGSYTERVCVYSAEHFEHERNDKLLLMDAREGLAAGEFSFVLHPQVHAGTGGVIGAEALIRWNHNGQMIPPASFIPNLEKSGYIYEFDRFMWEEVCKWQRSVIDRGIKPLPCSINVSRMDFFFADIAEDFIGLINKYDISPELICIEITESAFADNMDQIQNAIRKLHDAGFLIYMDDFGSGSSSLSMLHKMNVDAIKTDVNFMSRDDSDERAISIVESVINMAHLIGILVITEGVETEKQRDDLMAMGDNYAQGFYFFEPMPPEEYEEILKNPDSIGRQPVKDGPIMTNRLRFKDMISEGILNDTLLDNIIGPAAVFRRKDDELELIQINEAYYNLTGIEPSDKEAMRRYSSHFHKGSYEEVFAAFRAADEHPIDGAPVQGMFVRDDGKTVRLDSRIFPLYTLADHKLYLSVLQD